MGFEGNILAIANFRKRIKKQVPCERYVHSMKFTNEFITSVHDGKGDSLRERYREMVIPVLDSSS
ncbi:hypothetical protein GTY54_34410 [Streptomyces sp. SID625]|nr:hypothetical protein [Streptomyces sp. SID625]